MTPVDQMIADAIASLSLPKVLTCYRTLMLNPDSRRRLTYDPFALCISCIHRVAVVGTKGDGSTLQLSRDQFEKLNQDGSKYNLSICDDVFALQQTWALLPSQQPLRDPESWN